MIAYKIFEISPIGGSYVLKDVEVSEMVESWPEEKTAIDTLNYHLKHGGLDANRDYTVMKIVNVL